MLALHSNLFYEKSAPFDENVLIWVGITKSYCILSTG